MRVKTFTNADKVIQKWSKSLDTIRVHSQDIGKRTAERLAEDIDTRYGEFIAEHGRDGQQRTPYSVTSTRRNDGLYNVTITGPQVIYDEYGTGEMGLNNPHPNPGAYTGGSIQPYLSGPTIKVDKNGNFYWTFKNGSKYYRTHGVPAGAFVYESLMEAADRGNSELACKELNKLIKREMGK
jgi:hypothetical protein